MRKALIFFIAVLLAVLPVLSSCGGEEEVPLNVVLSPAEINMSVGDQYALQVGIFPKKYQNREIIWSVSDNSVIECDGGIISAIAPGEAIVYATVGSVRKVCRVKVNDIKTNIIVGDKLTVSADIRELIKDATEISVSSPDVITFEDYTITANKVGEAYVKAHFENGDVVTVARVSVRDISLTCEDIPFSLITNSELGTEILFSDFQVHKQYYSTDNYFVQFAFKYKRVDTLIDENMRVNFTVTLYSSEVEGEFCRDVNVGVMMNPGNEYTFVDAGFLAKLNEEGNRNFWIEITANAEGEGE